MPAIPESLDPHAVAVFIDVDGTLLDIRETPGEVVADESLSKLLQACQGKLDGALSLVSGRSIAEIDRIFAPVEFSAAGAHGAELRANGRSHASATATGFPDAARIELEDFARRDDALLLETKQGGASLHYRRAPYLKEQCREIVEKVLTDLGDSYRLIAGKMVYEIAPAVHDKGAAIRRLLEIDPFTGRIPVFLGDDATDEDGFRAVNHLGGLSIRVGDVTASEANHSLEDVAAVRNWLAQAILENPGNNPGGFTI